MIIVVDLPDFTEVPTFVPGIVPLKCSKCTNCLIQSKDRILYYTFLPDIKRFGPELSVMDKIPAIVMLHCRSIDELLIHYYLILLKFCQVGPVLVRSDS